MEFQVLIIKSNFYLGRRIRDGNKNKKSAALSEAGSQISVEYLNEVRETLKNNQHKNSTKRAYHGVWTNFNNFVIRLDYPPEKWEERVSLYCAYLTAHTEIQSSTLRSYVSAIKSKLCTDGYVWNQELVYLSSLIRGCKLKNDVIKVRLPISRSLLEIILFEIERRYLILNRQEYECSLYKTAYITLYYGLMRVGEVAASEHAVKAMDVHDAQNKSKFLFVLHSSKMHSRADRPQRIRIEADLNDSNPSDGINFSPTEEISNYLNMRGCRINDEELFFVHFDKRPFLCTELRNELRSILDHVGLRSELYDVHSFRIGRATDLYKRNVPIEQIQEKGRWKSNAVYKYLKV